MADAKPGVHLSSLRTVQVPEALIKGEKFIKWDEDNGAASPVTLRIDSKAYFLSWRDQNGVVDCLEISQIRDTRNGRCAKIPKDGKIRDLCNALGSNECNVPIGDKTMTVVYGPDLINLQFINFVASSGEVAKEWADTIFSIATDVLAKYPSFFHILEKMWTRFRILTTHDYERGGKVQVKHIYKSLASHKDDKKRIEKALQSCQWPTSKTGFIDCTEFTFEKFMIFYKSITLRNEFSIVCEDLNFKKKPYLHLTTEQFVNFLNEKQRDPRLNEILYPYANHCKAREFIQKYETNPDLVKEGHLSLEGLQAYLMSVDNAIIPVDAMDISQDMDQPLAHYFINSSHNTYLTGHQLTGKSSVELYRQVLLTGCRCIELDCWDGKEDLEPIVTHGFTMCTEISFRDVIDAIVETAFKVSDYPVILSFENHCSPKQQSTMVQIIKEKFGEKLLKTPLESHPLEPSVPLPSPAQLKGYFLIKNKRLQSKKEENEDAEENEAEEEMDFNKKEFDEKDPRHKEPTTNWEISAMVNYIEPAPFYSFEASLKKNLSFECCSFAETQATNILKEQPVEFVNFNKRQISRIYPKGTRVDSGNYMPQLFWNAGCQLVALNFQTLDLALQLNLGIFEYQKSCGYILKPVFMRIPDRRFDPFAESTVDGIVANTLTIQIISGLFLSDRRVGTFVEVEMYGLPADTVRKRFKTKIIPANGINPVYMDEPMIFKKVVLPELAVLRLAVYEETGKLIGHRILPVNWLRPGYKYIPLRNEANMPLSSQTLFVKIAVKDYIPDAFADFAAALSNPIAYVEKHSQQLSVLIDDFEEHIDDMESNYTKRKVGSEEKYQNERSKEKASFSCENSKEYANDPTGSYKTINRAATIHNPIHNVTSSVVAASGNSRAVSLNVKMVDADSSHFSSKSILNEANCLPQLTIDDLRQEKKCVKLFVKMIKDIDLLKKRNEKAVMNLKEKQNVELQQITATFNKNHRSKRYWAFGRSSANSSNVNAIAFDETAQSELQTLLEERKKNHEEDMRQLLLQQAYSEREQYSTAQDTFFEQMEDVLTRNSAMMIGKLKSIYENELVVLRKLQDESRRRDIRDMSKTHKEKQELARVKREMGQRHISCAVAERQQLRELFEKRESELNSKLEALKNELENEKAQEEELRQAAFETQCGLANELCGLSK